MARCLWQSQRHEGNYREALALATAGLSYCCTCPARAFNVWAVFTTALPDIMPQAGEYRRQNEAAASGDAFYDALRGDIEADPQLAAKILYPPPRRTVLLIIWPWWSTIIFRGDEDRPRRRFNQATVRQLSLYKQFGWRALVTCTFRWRSTNKALNFSSKSCPCALRPERRSRQYWSRALRF